MKKLYLVLLVIALLLSGRVISEWWNKDMTLAQTQSRPDFKPQDYTKAPAAHVVYNMLFKKVIYLNRNATAETASGQSGAPFQTLRQSIKRRLNLTDAQDLILNNIAAECASEADPIDQQAIEIIRSFRAKFPPGHVFTEEDRPKTPKELEELQDRHDEVILKYRDRLRQQLGETGFANFESALYRNFGSKITTVPKPPKKIK